MYDVSDVLVTFYRRLLREDPILLMLALVMFRNCGIICLLSLPIWYDVDGF